MYMIYKKKNYQTHKETQTTKQAKSTSKTAN